MNVRRAIVCYFSPFYDHARRWLGWKPSSVDKLLAMPGAHAEVNGRALRVTTDHDGIFETSGSFIHGKKIAGWVGEFNRRAGQQNPPIQPPGRP
jgi:hypothetical protein